jgi:hypothetical protein
MQANGGKMRINLTSVLVDDTCGNLIQIAAHG